MNVPVWNPNFTGRDAVLFEIRELLCVIDPQAF